MSLKSKNLICHTDLVMEPSCTNGTPYKIVTDQEDELGIINNHGTLHYFSKRPTDDSYYGNWFNLEN